MLLPSLFRAGLETVAWVTFASILNFSIWQLNEGKAKRLGSYNGRMKQTSLTLLQQARSANKLESEQAWHRLNEIYSPLIQNWLKRQSVLGAESDDLTQDVLLVLMRKLPSFQHNGNPGAFRKWLRLVVVNCARDFWKTKRIRPQAPGDTTFLVQLNQLADDGSEMTGKWNLEHDLTVMERLLEQVQPLVKPSTWSAFEQTALAGRNPDEVAAELGISVASVYTSKSRVLTKLRKFAGELLD